MMPGHDSVKRGVIQDETVSQKPKWRVSFGELVADGVVGKGTRRGCERFVDGPPLGVWVGVVVVRLWVIGER